MGTTTRERREAKAYARQWFDSWAASYDRSLLNFFLFRPCYVAMLQEVAEWYDKRRGGVEAIPGEVHHHGRSLSADPSYGTGGAAGNRPVRLLDVGCGTATFAELVLSAGARLAVIGMDYSPAMCTVASRKLARRPGAESAVVLAGDSEHLPLADASVDLITCANSFHHYPRQGAVVREMRRILRPGGRLILLDGFRDNAVGWFVFEGVVARIEKDVHHATWQEMRSYFSDAGLRDIQQRKFSFLFPVLVTTGDA